MKKIQIVSLAVSIWVVAGILEAATQIYALSLSNSAACPGQAVTATVSYCQDQDNTNSFFLGALNTSNSATILPCPNANQFFTVDSNGIGVTDSTPPGGWNASDSSPVSACHAVTWIFAIPSYAVLGSQYAFVVAGGNSNLICGSLPDSQASTIVMVCGPSPTCTPTLTPTLTATLPMTITPTHTKTVTPTVSPTRTMAVSPTQTMTFVNTPTFVYTPLYTLTPVLTDTPSFTSTPYLTDTPTLIVTPTPDPTPIFPTPAWTDTPTATFVSTPSGPITIIYMNGAGACSSAFGCSISFVNACRQLYLDFETSYIIMRLGATCGCQPSDIMQLRLTMSWDEICANYGLDWSAFVADLQTRVATLAPEIDTPTMIMRSDTNDPSQFPMTQPVPMPDHLTYVQAVTEVVPVCH
jgi:hypothetical protein